MSKDKNHIDKLTPQLIEKYLGDSLSNQQMHEVEKLMLESDFDREAIEGFEAAGIEGIGADLNNLNDHLASRVGRKVKKPFYYLKIAASILLLAILTYTTIQLIPDDLNESIGQVEAQEEAFEEKLEIPEEEKPVASKEKTNEASAQTPKTVLEEAPIEEEIIEEQSTSDVVALNEPEEFLLVEEDKAEEDSGLDFENTEAPSQEAKKEITDLLQAKKRVAAAKSAPQNTPVPQSLVGNVVDDDSTPLPGVNVVVKGSTVGAITDMQGSFSLEVPQNADSTLVASFIGYESREVSVAGKKSVNIQLAEDIQPLSEVVVSAGEVRKEKSNLNDEATPAIGFKAYQEYLNTNSRVNGKRQTVTVSFLVNKDGDLSTFKIINGATKELNDKAIELIKNGPLWTPATKDNQSVADTVDIKLTFKPKK